MRAKISGFQKFWKINPTKYKPQSEAAQYAMHTMHRDFLWFRFVGIEV